MNCEHCCKQNVNVNEEGLCSNCESAMQIKKENQEREETAQQKIYYNALNKMVARSQEDILNDIKKCGIDDPKEKKLWHELRIARAMNM